jgi:hypothetical protein
MRTGQCLNQKSLWVVAGQPEGSFVMKIARRSAVSTSELPENRELIEFSELSELRLKPWANGVEHY